MGTAAGETENPKDILPKAINGVIWRIVLFYIGSVVLLVSVLPDQACPHPKTGQLACMGTAIRMKERMII